MSWHRYHEEYSPYLEVLFAESQLYPAELNAIKTKAATFVSLINIYMAMGGGWVTKANEMTFDQTTNQPLNLLKKESHTEKPSTEQIRLKSVR